MPVRDRSARSACRAAGDGALEPVEVELVVGDLEQIAGSARVQARLGQDLSQLRDVDLHHLVGRVRRIIAPERVDDLLAGDGAVRVQEELREKRALLACRHLHRLALAKHLERAENTEVHLRDVRDAIRVAAPRKSVPIAAPSAP